MRITKYPGFTVMELLIVVATIGIIAMLAYPSYQQHVLRSRRAEGQSLLNAAAARQEHYRAQNGDYASQVSELQLPYGSQSENGFYRLEMVVSKMGYTLVAIPQEGQAGDVWCGRLILTDDGHKKSSIGDAELCWI